MSRWTDDALYRRGIETLVGSWEEYAGAAGGASLRRLPDVPAAVFPPEPKRSVSHTTPLSPDLPAAGSAARAASRALARPAIRPMPRYSWCSTSSCARCPNAAPARIRRASRSARALLRPSRLHRPPPATAKYRNTKL